MPMTLPRTWSAWSLKRLRKAEGIVIGLGSGGGGGGRRSADLLILNSCYGVSCGNAGLGRVEGLTGSKKEAWLTVERLTVEAALAYSRRRGLVTACS
jgi:hypothetical protein